MTMAESKSEMPHVNESTYNIPDQQQRDDDSKKNDSGGDSSGNDEEQQEHTISRMSSSKEDEPPNGGFGWVCVACTFLINAHTWGLNSSYGVLLAYYLSHDYFPGATHLEYAFVGGLSISCAMLVSPLATTTTRIFGTRTTLLIGVFFETLSLIAASFAKQIWQLFLSQGVCFGIGMGFLFVGSVGVIPQWFTTKRSFATAIGAAGSGIGGLVYSLAANAIIKSIDLPWAFRILGILACTVNLTCSLIIRDRLKAIGSAQLAFDYKLFYKIEFNLLMGWGFFSMLGYVTLLFSVAPFASSVGLTSSQGSLVSALFNLGQAMGRPPIGYFSDRTGRINMAMVMTFLSGLFALVIWIFAKSYGLLIFYSIVGGAVAGTFWATVAPVTAEVVGMKHLPSALSITWLNIVLPCTFSEAIALELAQNTGRSYMSAQLFAGFMYVGATLCLWVLRSIVLEKRNRETLKAGGMKDDELANMSSPFWAIGNPKRLFSLEKY